MRREESGEHDDVAEKKDPEAIADDDPFRGRSALAMPRRMAMAAAMVRDAPAAAPELVRVDARAPPMPQRFGRAHAGSSTGACSSSHFARAARRSRSMRATSSAGIRYSSTSRQANQT